jgi:hypothetical protein
VPHTAISCHLSISLVRQLFRGARRHRVAILNSISRIDYTQYGAHIRISPSACYLSVSLLLVRLALTQRRIHRLDFTALQFQRKTFFLLAPKLFLATFLCRSTFLVPLAPLSLLLLCKHAKLSLRRMFREKLSFLGSLASKTTRCLCRTVVCDIEIDAISFGVRARNAKRVRAAFVCLALFLSLSYRVVTAV